MTTEQKPMTMNWKLDVTTKEYYYHLVDSGMAWEFYPTLPGSWIECKVILEEEDNEVR